jgi:hypothetical protein
MHGGNAPHLFDLVAYWLDHGTLLVPYVRPLLTQG